MTAFNGWFIFGFVIYLVGGGIWFFYSYREWTYYRNTPEKRLVYGKRIIATFYWPFALLKEGLDLISSISSEVKKLEQERKE